MGNPLSEIRPRWDWKLYTLLLVLYLLGFAAGIPFVLSFQEYTTTGETFVSGLQGFLLGVAVLTLGLKLIIHTGLGAPYLDSWLSEKSRVISIKLVLSHSVFMVIGSSFFLIILRLIVKILAIAFGEDSSAMAVDPAGLFTNYPPIWQWFLVSFHAGVTEEILFRFGLMNLLAWVGLKFVNADKRIYKSAVFWLANLVAAFGFGVFHLYGVLRVPDVTFAQLSVVLQNTLVGLVFGWFYWQYGLESAMLTHFLLDVFTYVVMVPILMTMNLVLILAW